jgi:hypothetical protein
MRKLSILLALMVMSLSAAAQELYTARGYWEELNKEAYQKIRQKQSRGDSLSSNEKSYLADYETYLKSYYDRLTPEEKQRFEQMKPQWDNEAAKPTATSPAIPSQEPEEFDWQGRDRFMNGFYGLYYGLSIVALTEASDVAAGAIPLITTGAWLLGPALNERKYEGINRSVIRAGNTGKFLGLVNGATLGLALGGDSDETYKWALGLSSVGSIVMGEVGFQMQKQRQYPVGRIDMVRHYGLLMPWIGAATALAVQSESAHAYGAAMFAGGMAGMAIGSAVAKKYDYTQGDVDLIGSLSLLTTGLGFTAVIPIAEDIESSGLILIPAAATILGSVWGQKAVRGARFSSKQGTTINLAAGGAALIGFGIVALTESEEPAVIIGVPSVFGLLTHQILFSKYKKLNIGNSIQGSLGKEGRVSVSLKVTPESYFINKKIPVEGFTPEAYTQRINPLARIRLSF